MFCFTTQGPVTSHLNNKQRSHNNFATEKFSLSNTVHFNTQCMRKRYILFKMCLPASQCALRIFVGAWQVVSRK